MKNRSKSKGHFDLHKEIAKAQVELRKQGLDKIANELQEARDTMAGEMLDEIKRIAGENLNNEAVPEKVQTIFKQVIEFIDYFLRTAWPIRLGRK